MDFSKSENKDYSCVEVTEYCNFKDYLQGLRSCFSMAENAQLLLWLQYANIVTFYGVYIGNKTICHNLGYRLAFFFLIGTLRDTANTSWYNCSFSALR